MTVEARELYSSSMGPIVSGSRTPFRANVLRVAIIQEIAAVPRGTASLHGSACGEHRSSSISSIGSAAALLRPPFCLR